MLLLTLAESDEPSRGGLLTVKPQHRLFLMITVFCFVACRDLLFIINVDFY